MAAAYASELAAGQRAGDGSATSWRPQAVSSPLPPDYGGGAIPGAPSGGAVPRVVSGGVVAGAAGGAAVCSTNESARAALKFFVFPNLVLHLPILKAAPCC